MSLATHQGSPRRAVACSAAAALAGLVYLNALHTPFVYDDHRMVVENVAIQEPFNLQGVVLGAITRPMVNLSYALDYAMWGLQPFGYHLTNVLLHILNVVLLFHLAWRLVEDRGRRERTATNRTIEPLAVALATAVPFAVHPLMTSAVTYVTGRSEVLCATLFLLGFMAARQWMLGRGARWWCLSVALWLAALATKEIAAMFPFVLIGYERFVLRLSDAGRRRTRLTMHVPFVTLALAVGAARLAVLVLMEHPGEVAAHWEYFLVEVDVFRRYLGLMLIPQGQTIFHAVPNAALVDPGVLAGAAAVGLVIVTAWRLRRAAPVASFGLLWFLLLLVPSSALVVLDRGEPMAEHRVYLASCGFFLFAGTGIQWLLARSAVGSDRQRPIVQGLLAMALIVLCGRTLHRNAVWSSPIGLWQEAVDKAPGHWLPRLLLGESLHVAGRRDEAIAEYNQAIKLRPEEQAAYQKLALSLVEERRFENAMATFESLRRLDPLSAVASNGLGIVALVVGEPDRARAYLLETLANHPDNVPARQMLAQIAEMEPAKPAEALRLCREIQQLAPRTPGNDDCIRRNESRVAVPAAGSH